MYVSTKLSGYGADVFTVSQHAQRDLLGRRNISSIQKRKIVRIEDYEAVRDGCSHCSEVGAMLSQVDDVVATTGTPATTRRCAATPGRCSRCNNMDIALGRGFTPADEEHATHDVIVGYDIVDNLLGAGDPIGKEIRVDGVPYTIVGVGDAAGQDAGPVAGQLGGGSDHHLPADLRLQRFG